MVIKGNKDSHLLISASHSKSHIRDSKQKWEDLYTGEIAKEVAIATGSHCIYLVEDVGYDPNHDLYERNPYKQELKKYIEENDIQFVVDLHGMTNKYPYKVEIGTSIEYPNKETLLKPIIQVFHEELGKDVVVDEFFKASKTPTVARFVIEQCHTPAIQIEIGRDLREPPFDRITGILIEAIEGITKHAICSSS